MTGVMQPQLFDSFDLVGAEFASAKAFINRELIGVDLIEEDGALIAVDIMTIAAEGIASAIAASRGDIDMNNESLLSETILGRINHPDFSGPFVFDMDEELADYTLAEDPVVELLSMRALELAQASVDLVRYENFVTEGKR